MEFVPGIPYRSARDLAALGPDHTRALADGLVDTMVDLHAVDPTEIGLEGFGRPVGFLTDLNEHAATEIGGFAVAGDTTTRRARAAPMPPRYRDFA